MTDYLSLMALREGQGGDPCLTTAEEARSWALVQRGLSGPPIVYLTTPNFAVAAEEAHRVSLKAPELHVELKTVEVHFRSEDMVDLCGLVFNRIEADLEAEPARSPEGYANAFNAHPLAPIYDRLEDATPDKRTLRPALIVYPHSAEGGLRCEISDAEKWTIWLPWQPHCERTYDDETALAEALADMLPEAGASPIKIVSRSQVITAKNVPDLPYVLTEMISDDIPDIEDEDARVDDFDNHDLTPLRDALMDTAVASQAPTPSL